MNPEGTQGLPTAGGEVGRYTDFYWLMSTTPSSFTGTQQFDLDLQANNIGISFSSQSVLRIIRRQDGNAATNPWSIQGTAANYDNFLVVVGSDTTVTVRTTSSQGGLVTAGSRFTIGTPAGLPSFNLPTTLAYTVAENATQLIPVKAIANAVNTTISTIELLNAPSFVSYASVSADTGTVTVAPTFTDASTTPYTVDLKATDNNGGTTTITLSITVNDVNSIPVFTAKLDTGSVRTGVTTNFTYIATDADAGDTTLTFFLQSTSGGPANAAAITSAGVFSWVSASADSGKTITFVVAVTDGKDTAETSAALTVVGNSAPTWATGGEQTNQTIFVGDTLNFTYMAEDADNDPITYAFVGNSPSNASLDASTGVFSWAPQTASAFPVLITVSASDGTTAIQTSAQININLSTVTVSGAVTYENTSNTPIIGAVVTLWDGTTLVATDTTVAGGAYSFAGVTGGITYTVNVSKTDGWPSSAVLASDALLAARSSVDTTVTLTALQTLAADVTGNGNVTAGDALQILRRVVGQITSFAIADWQFESNTIAVASLSVTVNVKGIAAGDVNASATTLPKKSKVTVISGKNVNISLNSKFELPVSINAAQAVGAFTLRFTYPVQMMTFKSVKSNVGIISYAEDNKISIAWAQMPGERSLKDGETPTIVFVFKATKAFARSASAGLTLDNGEIVNVFGKNMADASVNMSQAEVAIPLTFALSQNYPNPFNPSTIIEYQLPVKGNVTLTIFNTLGQRVVTLIDNQEVEAGSYKTRWNAKNLASGIYFYSLRVEGIKGFLKTRKMILLK